MFRRQRRDAHVSPPPGVADGYPRTGYEPDPDELAPRMPFTWGDMSEIWTLCALNPTRANRAIRTLIERAFREHFGEPLTLGDFMGMFDREPNFEEAFKIGDRMVIVGLKYIGTISTAKGPAEKSLVTVVTRESYPGRATYSVLGTGIAAMAQRADGSDFPVVVEFRKVPLASGNAVKRFEPVLDKKGDRLDPTKWKDGDDGVPVIIEPPTATPGNVTTARNDDPGF